ncbi:unnamed protein product, partial [Amoebophrya sp. A25]
FYPPDSLSGGGASGTSASSETSSASSWNATAEALLHTMDCRDRREVTALFMTDEERGKRMRSGWTPA